MSSVISKEWLFQHIDDKDVVILDCRFSLGEPNLGREEYQKGHIVGSYYLDLNIDLSSQVRKHGGRHPLPNPEELAGKLSEMGVNFQKSLVIAYDDSRFAFASRLWWLLRYFGHERVGVLDGGFSEWLKAEYPVTADIPKPRVGNFTPQVQQQMVVDWGIVNGSKDSSQVILIDSRESDRYQGIREPIDPIAGHIAGAVNYPWQEVTDSKGYALPQQEQLKRWQKLQADRENKEIIVYCGSGVTACVNLLSLELAGFGSCKLYAGSWSDWCSYLV
jgi:thiosulfate/3-mercaptopyruvate sulfurtransferase